MCDAFGEWPVDELAALPRRAHPFRQLGRRSMESVLDMLSGRCPSEEFAELVAVVRRHARRGSARGFGRGA